MFVLHDQIKNKKIYNYKFRRLPTANWTGNGKREKGERKVRGRGFNIVCLIERLSYVLQIGSDNNHRHKEYNPVY